MNPLASILSAAMMLDHLELPEAAHEIEQAVAKALSGCRARTADPGGRSSTREATDAVLDQF